MDVLLRVRDLQEVKLVLLQPPQGVHNLHHLVILADDILEGKILFYRRRRGHRIARLATEQDPVLVAGDQASVLDLGYDELAQDTADTPDIDFSIILLEHNNFRSSIVACLNMLSVLSVNDLVIISTLLLRSNLRGRKGVDFAAEAKVAELDVEVFVDENV